MALTRIELINHALSMGQLDSSFQTDARTWLNITLAELGLRFDYRFYRLKVDAPFVGSQKEYTLPATFQRPDTLFFLDANNNVGNPILILDPYNFDVYNTGSITGPPVAATIDQRNQKLVFNSVPVVPNGMEYRLWYYKTAPVYSTTSADDTVVPDFEDQKMLIEELILTAYRFLNDDREKTQEVKVKKTRQEYLINTSMSDDASQMPLNYAIFRNTRRRIGRRGFTG